MPRLAALGALAAAVASAAWVVLDPAHSGLPLLLAAVGLLVAGAAWLETGPDAAKEIVLVATLAAVAAAGRVLFVAIPGVQPVTVITVAAGAALGPRAGFATGALAALSSNFFLGQGPWTPWQMLGWGACGVAGSALAPLIRRRSTFAAVCFVLGFAFSALMDLWLWVTFWPHTWQALTVVFGQGVLVPGCARDRQRRDRVGDRPGAVTAAGALRETAANRGRLGMKLALAAVALALAATPADYVAAHQQSDGGFAEPGQSSDPSLTAWAVLGLSAAGREPARSPTGYLDGSPTRTANDLALRILALDALGRDTDSLTDRLEGMRGPRGRIGTLVNSTIWGVIALRATGRPAGTSIRYLLRSQRKSGGWSWHPRGAPDSNDTAAAVQALRAAGVPARSRSIRKGLSYLRSLQRPDGGFALGPGRAADAQSTAWAIQAFVAAGKQPGTRAFRYLAQLRQADGSYRYSKRYAATPVWVTSQVLPALARKPFPLG